MLYASWSLANSYYARSRRKGIQMSYFLAFLLSFMGFGPADTPGGLVSCVTAPAPVVATIGTPIA